MPISASHVQQLPSTSRVPKIALKLAFSNNECRHFVRAACTDANDTPYARPFSPPSNRVYRMLLRPSVLEESTQDRSGVGSFFPPFFPFLMLTQWCTSSRGSRGLLVARGANSNAKYFSSDITTCQIWLCYIQRLGYNPYLRNSTVPILIRPNAPAFPC